MLLNFSAEMGAGVSNMAMSTERKLKCLTSTFLCEQMSAEKTADDSDVGFENGDVDVGVEIRPRLGDQVVDPVELCEVAHDGQRVER